MRKPACMGGNVWVASLATFSVDFRRGALHVNQARFQCRQFVQVHDCSNIRQMKASSNLARV